MNRTPLAQCPDRTLRWLERFKGRDYAAMLLAAGADEELRWAALQAECRRKAAAKLPALVANADVIFPTLLSVEQCTSEALAAYHAALVPRGSRVLDMTSGLGVDAMTIARTSGCRVTAIDINPEVSAALAHNARAMGADGVEALCADSVEWLRGFEGEYDVIFIDPARRSDWGGRIFNLSDCRPDVVALLPDMLRVAPEVIIKASPMFDVTRAVSELAGHALAVRLLGTQGECKELLITCRREMPAAVAMEAVTIAGGEVSTFAWTEGEGAVTLCPEVAAGMMLYEPWPAVMKSGAYGALCARFGVSQPNDNTHLFLSADAAAGFPGQAYEIIETCSCSKPDLKRLAARYGRANVAVRNFTMSAPELEKKLKMKSGGSVKIFGLRAGAGTGRPLLAVASPVTSQTCEP